MMPKLSNNKIYLFYLITISAFIRCIIANVVELGGEEAYYWTFALYPKLCYLDQPPMIGWLIQLFTINLSVNSELFIRIVSIFIASVNTWIIFVLGRRMRNELTGLYAAVLYTTSIYCSIVSGVFITPDAPQSLFILLSIYFLNEGFISKYEDNDESRTLSSISIIMAGIFIGLAVISKFSSALIWVGALIYLIFFDKRFLKKPQLYISIFISLLILSPVILWNIKYNYVGFWFLDNVVIALTNNLSINSIVKALFKVIIYNNPVNICLAIIAILSFRKINYLKPAQYKFLLAISAPFLLTGFVSIGFFPLILLSALYMESNHHFSRTILPGILRKSIFAVLLIVLLGLFQLYSGFLNFETKRSPEIKIGNNDFTLDMFGWKELAKEFNSIRNQDVALGNISEHAYIIANNYAAAAHYDYYLGKPNNIFVKTIGNISETRKYAFTTPESEGFKIGESAYYIESSRDRASGKEIGERFFNSFDIAKIIYLRRAEKPVLRFTIYRFKEFKTIPPKELWSVPMSY